MTELPSYCLELAPATGSDSIANWARSAGVPASVLIDRFKPATCEATHPDGSGTVVLGHPIRGERIDVRRICSEVPHYINDDNWIAAINGEFLILHASKRSLFVITSRFGYPSLWYGENGNRTVLGTLFADVRDRVLEIGEERLNLQAIFETLTYKRVFGSKT
ncbi:MAG: hypothetical protein MI741_08775, partial [Rhodospirillales bacterium]|nr:hypothetical protein [Rhodospirillales bacterium]